jgi:hypothetical protein
MKIIARAIVQEITRNVSKIGGHVNFKINRLYLIVDTFGTVYILYCRLGTVCVGAVKILKKREMMQHHGGVRVGGGGRGQ